MGSVNRREAGSAVLKIASGQAAGLELHSLDLAI